MILDNPTLRLSTGMYLLSTAPPHNLLVEDILILVCLPKTIVWKLTGSYHCLPLLGKGETWRDFYFHCI